MGGDGALKAGAGIGREGREELVGALWVEGEAGGFDAKREAQRLSGVEEGQGRGAVARGEVADVGDGLGGVLLKGGVVGGELEDQGAGRHALVGRQFEACPVWMGFGSVAAGQGERGEGEHRDQGADGNVSPLRAGALGVVHGETLSAQLVRPLSLTLQT